ncbi:MAG TPA: ammonium transporter, partial [Alphaproteobacteria bacterium]|nr:ammonium transporter [Alphaproteobacteria bacterium]
MKGRIGIGAAVAALAATLSAPAFAQAAEQVSETAYIFNSLSFLMHGFLVMWMAAGFTMLEAGLVRTKSVATICLKNVALFSIAGIMFYLLGYNLMYDGVDGGII